LFGSDSVEERLQVSDQAFWPLAELMTTQDRALAEDEIETRPAPESPYAELLTNACSAEVVGQSWWVKLCPGPCADPTVAQLASLTGNAYLIERNGRLLVWAAE
jgi:hypothetical protein